MLKRKLIENKYLALQILCLSAFFVASPVSAHGLATQEHFLAGDKLVILEYETLGNMRAGEVTTFNFELQDVQTGKNIQFDRVFVTVNKKSGPIVFLSNIFPLDVAGVTASRARFYIPTEGPHEFEVQYFMGENKLAEHIFELTVEKDPGEKGGITAHLWIITLIGGLVAGVYINKILKLAR